MTPDNFDPSKHARKLNVGCGPDHRAGFVNVDLNAWYKPDLVADVRHLEFLPSQYYDEIVAQDVLEHLPRIATLPTLAGWNRILRPGGRLVLRIPSILGIAELLKNGANATVGAQEELIQCMFGTQAYTGDFHYTGFTEIVLRDYLRQAGFAAEEIPLLHGWLFDFAAEKVAHLEQSPFADFSALLEAKGDGEFVERCYREILRREGDAGGKAFFLDGLQRGMGRSEVIQIMLGGPEYAATKKLPR